MAPWVGTTWLESNGGPLVVLEDRLLGSWTGIGEGDGRRGSGTDYDRACAVTDWIGVVESGEGVALVLAGEPTPTRVLNARETLLIRWIHGPEGWDPGDPDLLLDQDWRRSAVWAVESPIQVMQDAAFAGLDEDTEKARMQVAPGQYEVLTAEYRPDPQVWMVLHWLRRMVV